MTRIRLHNDDWGYETNCFVCEPANAAGLQIPFFHEPDASQVVADFDLSNGFSGAPNLVHGGVTLAVLDEAMAWACIAVGHRWAMTATTTTRFDRPLFVDSTYRVVAHILAQTEETIDATAQIVFTDKTGTEKVCAHASATFTVLGEAQVQRITGKEDVDTTYTSDG